MLNNKNWVNENWDIVGISPLNKVLRGNGIKQKEVFNLASRIRNDDKNMIDLIYFGSIRVVIDYTKNGELVVDVVKRLVSPGTLQDYKREGKEISNLCTGVYRKEFAAKTFSGSRIAMYKHIESIFKNLK